MFISILAFCLMIGALLILISVLSMNLVIYYRKSNKLHWTNHKLQAENKYLAQRNEELAELQKELWQANERLEQLAITDGLTGCFNRRYLNKYLEYEIMLNQRYQTQYTILLFDIDLFKKINDTYGHLIGDDVLISTANVVKQTLRQSDMMARYGGEEFTIYLPRTMGKQAMHLAQRIREAVEDNIIHTKKGPIQVTISIGFVSICSHSEITLEPKEQLQHIFSRADAALYKAKHKGRNQIIQCKQII